MSKALKHIGRRSLLKAGAALTTASTAFRIPAIAAAGTRDPILDMIDRIERLRSLGRAASDRAQVARESVGGDCSGTGWPQLDESRPEFRGMAEWLKGSDWWKPDFGISRSEIEGFNTAQEMAYVGDDTAFLPSAIAKAVNSVNAGDRTAAEVALHSSARCPATIAASRPWRFTNRLAARHMSISGIIAVACSAP
jgi:hypothetical protein